MEIATGFHGAPWRSAMGFEGPRDDWVRLLALDFRDAYAIILGDMGRLARNSNNYYDGDIWAVGRSAVS